MIFCIIEYKTEPPYNKYVIRMFTDYHEAMGDLRRRNRNNESVYMMKVKFK